MLWASSLIVLCQFLSVACQSVSRHTRHVRRPCRRGMKRECQKWTIWPASVKNESAKQETSAFSLSEQNLYTGRMPNITRQPTTYVRLHPPATPPHPHLSRCTCAGPHEVLARMTRTTSSQKRPERPADCVQIASMPVPVLLRRNNLTVNAQVYCLCGCTYMVRHTVQQSVKFISCRRKFAKPVYLVRY